MPEFENEQISIAVIGLSCRFPGTATNPERFWDLLCRAESAYSENDHFNPAAHANNPSGRSVARLPNGAHFLAQDVSAFDAKFFHINANEASAIDPQQRMMLELVYEALENAGLPMEKVAGSHTSCIVGNFNTDYREILFRDLDFAPLHTIDGTGSELLSNRISWFYDLKGPSFTLGTACSSSLVALHQGCQSLRSGESEMAIVGGSNLLISPDTTVAMSNLGFLAEDGRSKSFSAKADGYGRGEGCAALVLKRVDHAIRDNDLIRAVIRGTGVNHDGKTKGISVPSAEAQADLITSTYQSAGLNPCYTRYVEAHGTGTRIGDPLELQAIAKGFKSSYDPEQPLFVGSVKPNIGHLEATAGLAGIIKGIYILEHGKIPPNLFFDIPNQKILFKEWNIEIPVSMKTWPANGLRRLSIQSFGYGGTNAHAILDGVATYLKEKESGGAKQAIQSSWSENTSSASLTRDPGSRSSGSTQGRLDSQQDCLAKNFWLYVISAQDQDGLKRQKASILKWLLQRSTQRESSSPCSTDTFLHDFAYTLGERRSQMAWRLTWTACTFETVHSCLEKADESMQSSRRVGQPKLGFIFNGQGAQWARMGFELSHYKTFRESLCTSDDYLRHHLGCPWSAVEELSQEMSDSKINRPAYAQPLCTILQIALVDLLESWNILPSVLLGYSSGEIAAAYCLGALTKADALKIAYFRGLVSSQLSNSVTSGQGGMLAVGASEKQMQSWITELSQGTVVIACVNSPTSVTVSGDLLGIKKLGLLLKQKNVYVKLLQVETAYHSPFMECISDLYLEAIRDILPSPGNPHRQMYSSLTGDTVDSLDLGPASWVRNLLAPVQFYSAFYNMMQPTLENERGTANGVDVLLEIGPHSVLGTYVKQITEAHDIQEVAYYPMLLRGQNATEIALASVGKLFTRGVPINISEINKRAGQTPKLLSDMPPYVWDHSQSFWSESRASKEHRLRQGSQSYLLGPIYSSLGEGQKLWRKLWRVSDSQWLRDHKVQGTIIFPAAGYLAMAVEAASQIGYQDRMIRQYKVREFQITAPFVLGDGLEFETVFQIRRHLNGSVDRVSSWWEFVVSTCKEKQQLRHNCQGLLSIDYQPAENQLMKFEQDSEDEAHAMIHKTIKGVCRSHDPPEEFYDDLAQIGFAYGASLRNISQLRLAEGRSYCAIRIPVLEDPPGPCIIHPAILDSIFHSLFAATKPYDGKSRQAFAPKRIDEIAISANVAFEPKSELTCSCSATKYGSRHVIADIITFEKYSSIPAVNIKGLRSSLLPTIGIDTAPRKFSENTMFAKVVRGPAERLPLTVAQNSIFTIMKPSNTSFVVQRMAEKLACWLENRKIPVRVLEIDDDLNDLEGMNCISLLELDSPFLMDMNEQDFTLLQKIVKEAKSLLWVTGFSDPASALILGMSRSIRNEMPGKIFRTIQLRSTTSIHADRTIETIGELAIRATVDFEFVENAGELETCRIIQDEVMDQEIYSGMQDTTHNGFSNPEARAKFPLKLALTSPEMSENFCLEAADSEPSELYIDELEIEVKATGLNFHDLSSVTGQNPDQCLGLEASGVIIHVGNSVTKFKTGDNVCVIGRDTHKALIRTKEEFCQMMPDGLSFNHAASIPLAHSTAVYALLYLVAAQPGQSILIHAVAGGVGQAALQIAKHIGLEIFATVGSSNKRKLIKEFYGISDNHIFDSRDLSFSKGVLRMTKNRGIDYIINSLSGETMLETWKCVAPFGSFVHIGTKDVLDNTNLNMRPFLRNVSFNCVNMTKLMDDKPQLMAALMKRTFQLLHEGVIRPVSPVSVYSIFKIREATQLMQSGQHSGKIVLNWASRDEMAGHDTLLTTPTFPSVLDPNASYMLVGGLGGLGRSLSKLLLRLGARHLSFLSRCGARTSGPQQLLRDLNLRNVKCTVHCCDVADPVALDQVFSQYPSHLPPIRGVFQCAMVIRDSVFERMTYSQWVESLRPKAQGSWNLHRSLPENLDFHVTLSSIMGLIGGRGQSNYAAGATYQDALALHRRSQGLKAVSIDLGVMRGIGLLAEQGATNYVKEWEIPFGMHEPKFQHLVEHIIYTEKYRPGLISAQIITGLATGGTAQTAGIRRPFYFDDPRFSVLAQTGLSDAQHSKLRETNHSSRCLSEHLQDTASLADAATVVKEAIVFRLANLLNTEPSEIDEMRPVYFYGVDSLGAVEIADWILKQLKLMISVFEILATVSISEFARDLALRSPDLPPRLRTE